MLETLKPLQRQDHLQCFWNGFQRVPLRHIDEEYVSVFMKQNRQRRTRPNSDPGDLSSILLVCPWDATEGGGVQVAFRNLVGELQKRGKGTHLIYPAAGRVRLEKRRNPWGHEAYYFPLRGLVSSRLKAPFVVLAFLAYLPLTLLRILSIIKRHNIQVINCHYVMDYMIHFLWASRIMGVKLVVSVHGADIDSYRQERWLPRLLLRALLSGADRIVGCSNSMAMDTVRALPERSLREKATHVHNGLVLEDFESELKPCPISSPFVLSVCHQVKKKGVDTLLRAFALVGERFNDLELVLIGDGPLLEENRALATKLKIDRKTRFLGRMSREEARSYFSACSVFVLPSRAEPFGIVLLEASYYKKGIVATLVGGIPEIISNGENGLLVEPDDVQKMAESIATLLNNKALADQLGKMAYRTVMERFLWKDRVEDYLAILVSLGWLL